MRIRTGLVLGLLLALSAAGCAGEGDSGDQVATAGGRTPEATASAESAGKGDDRDQILAFSRCMRENGVPEFPDPETNGSGGFSLSLPGDTDKEKVDAAQEKCKQHLPDGGEPPKPDPEQVETMREYARCMRENGVPKFPDPSEDGGFQLDGDQVGDPQSPAFKAAEEKCRSIMPGAPGTGRGGTSIRGRDA
ncbi:hypothetical protein [Phytohabitans kaempferiae]|uniref:Lipoprotein n=1 Tax=Phytohabitans kaempferiae TaxID=1620943 RepID=A0ABV6M424_9ACTN